MSRLINFDGTQTLVAQFDDALDDFFYALDSIAINRGMTSSVYLKEIGNYFGDDIETMYREYIEEAWDGVEENNG